MLLRNSVIVKVWEAIEESPFTAADFEVSFGNSKDDAVQIRFRHNKQYTFTIKEVYGGDVNSVEAPGEHKAVETWKLKDGYADIPLRVRAWTTNLRDELRSSIPIYSELDEIRAMVDEHIKKNVERPDEQFSPAEAAEIRTKLQELSEKFGKLQEQYDLTDQELQRILREIENVKQNVGTYPKGTWYKTSASKLWSLTSKLVTSTEGRKVLADAARKALGLDGPAP